MSSNEAIENQVEEQEESPVESAPESSVPESAPDSEAQEDSSEEELASAAELAELNAEDFEPEQKSALIEAILFAHGEPLSPGRIRQITGLAEKEVSDILESICMKFEIEDSGFRLLNVGGRYQFRTVQQFAPFVRKLKSSGPKRLSPAALETLAIVAYRQPIVKSDVEKIRGVDATPTLKTLIERRIIKIVGHKDTVGQPALYGTTDLFLKIFGLGSLGELPSLRDLKELEVDPGETEEEQAELFDQEEANDDVAEENSESEAHSEASGQDDAEDVEEEAQVGNG